MAGANMKIREIIMELGPVQHQDYTRIDSTPYEVKSKVNKREYNFAPSNAGVEGQLYRQVDKKLQPLILPCIKKDDCIMTTEPKRI